MGARGKTKRSASSNGNSTPESNTPDTATSSTADNNNSTVINNNDNNNNNNNNNNSTVTSNSNNNSNNNSTNNSNTTSHDEPPKSGSKASRSRRKQVVQLNVGGTRYATRAQHAARRARAAHVFRRALQVPRWLARVAVCVFVCAWLRVFLCVIWTCMCALLCVARSLAHRSSCHRVHLVAIVFLCARAMQAVLLVSGVLTRICSTL